MPFFEVMSKKIGAIMPMTVIEAGENIER